MEGTWYGKSCRIPFARPWWLIVFLALCIFLAVLSIHLIGDAISDAVAGTMVMVEKE